MTEEVEEGEEAAKVARQRHKQKLHEVEKNLGSERRVRGEE